MRQKEKIRFITLTLVIFILAGVMVGCSSKETDEIKR